MMDYRDVRAVASEVFREFGKERFEYGDCPKCGVSTIFLKFSVDRPAEEFDEWVEKLRCLNCLALFTKELKSEG